MISNGTHSFYSGAKRCHFWRVHRKRRVREQCCSWPCSELMCVDQDWTIWNSCTPSSMLISLFNTFQYNASGLTCDNLMKAVIDGHIDGLFWRWCCSISCCSYLLNQLTELDMQLNTVFMHNTTHARARIDHNVSSSLVVIGNAINPQLTNRTQNWKILD